MARLEREPKNPGRAARAELVRAATLEDWQARPGARLEKQGRDGQRLVVAKAPEFIYDAEGEVVGVDAWVQLFDEQGRELKIDPHRRIINPPTVPRSGVRLIDTGRAERGHPVMNRQVTADPSAAFWEAVWDSVESAPNPKGWRTRGTVTTVFAGTADAYVVSEDFNYSTARTGPGTLFFDVVDDNNHWVGQISDSGLYDCIEAFISFDTSAIADSDTVSGVSLDLWLLTDSSTGADFTVEAREKDWGASVTTADWVAGGSLGGLTLMASISTSGIGSTGAYKTFTSQTAFLTATGLKTGTVYLMLSSSRHRAGNTPSGNEYVVFQDAESTGTSQDPKLTITHEGALGSSPFFTSRPNRIWRLG